jgi:uncharacterized protein
MSEKDVIPTAVTAPLPSFGPVAPQERIEALDILRGFALFGILLANITWLLDSFAPYATRADFATKWMVNVFISWHFFPLFSFLFGVGFAIQLTRAEARQVPFLRVYPRRLGVLLLIGAAFFVFVEGERILLQYALLGAPLLLFRNRSPRALLAWALAFLVLGAVIGPIKGALVRAAGMAPATQAQTAVETEVAAREEANEVLLEEARITGDYGALVAARARKLFLLPPELQLPLLSIVFSMFLFGFYAHRRGVFKDLDANGRFVRQTLYWSVGVGIALTYANEALRPTYRTTPWVSYLPIWPIANAALTFSYMAAVVLLLRWGVARRVLTLLGWTGRMGLTNYVLHFVIVEIVFIYGFGLYKGPRQAMGPVFAVLVTLVPIPLSVWWLRRFRFGPLEWVWRSLTYGRRQPMLIEPATRSAARVPYLRAAVAAIAVFTTGVTLAVWEPPERRRGDEADIAKLEGEWRSALLSADTAALGRIATTTYRARGTSGEITNLAQLIESIASRTLRFDAITPGRVSVVAHENTASASGLETQVVSSRGRSVGGERRYVHWYVKRDGRWRLAISNLGRTP